MDGNLFSSLSASPEGLVDKARVEEAEFRADDLERIVSATQSTPQYSIPQYTSVNYSKLCTSLCTGRQSVLM